jgi:hypothetical protein
LDVACPCSMVPTAEVAAPTSPRPAPIPPKAAKAKAAGIYKGRVASIDAAQVRKLKADGIGASEIAKALKIGRASVYRLLGTAPQPLSGEA